MFSFSCQTVTTTNRRPLTRQTQRETNALFSTNSDRSLFWAGPRRTRAPTDEEIGCDGRSVSAKNGALMLSARSANRLPFSLEGGKQNKSNVRNWATTEKDTTVKPRNKGYP